MSVPEWHNKTLLLTGLVFLSLPIISNSLTPIPQASSHYTKMKTSSPSSPSVIRNGKSTPFSEISMKENEQRPLTALYDGYASDSSSSGLNHNDHHQHQNDNHSYSMKIRNQISRLISLRSGSTMATEQTKKEFIMAIALFASYFSVMGAKCALPSTFALITSDDSGLLLTNTQTTPQQLIAKVLTFSTCAVAVGKFLLGPIIDKYGGILCLKVALSSLMGLLTIISSTNSFNTFSMALICVDFIFSSCWAACLNAIHQVFPQDKWSSCIGLLAVAARVGNASSFFFFSYLLQFTQQRRAISGGGLVGQSWRNVYWASAAMQIIPIFLLMLSNNNYGEPSINRQHAEYNQVDKDESRLASPSSSLKSQRQHNNNIEQKDTSSIWKSIRTLQEEAKKGAFWMHLISRSCLMIIASFLLFVPSYMTNAFGLTSAESARVGSLYALGCLISVSFGSSCFPKLTTRGKLLSTLGFLGLVILISAINILHILGTISMSGLGGTILMFLWGIGFAVPFYIPPSLYALKRGGSDSSATSKL